MTLVICLISWPDLLRDKTKLNTLNIHSKSLPTGYVFSHFADRKLSSITAAPTVSEISDNFIHFTINLENGSSPTIEGRVLQNKHVYHLHVLTKLFTLGL